MKPGPKPADPLVRFNARTDQRGADECWPWLGTLIQDTGYGQFWMRGRKFTAQAAAYTLFIGEVPAGEQVDHTCHNADLTCPGGPACEHRRCVNPSHLEAVSRAENRDRAERRRKAAA